VKSRNGRWADVFGCRHGRAIHLRQRPEGAEIFFTMGFVQAYQKAMGLRKEGLRKEGLSSRILLDSFPNWSFESKKKYIKKNSNHVKSNKSYHQRDAKLFLFIVIITLRVEP
jgi:hypothetical protein